MGNCLSSKAVYEPAPTAANFTQPQQVATLPAPDKEGALQQQNVTQPQRPAPVQPPKVDEPQFVCDIWPAYDKIYVSGYEGAKDKEALKKLGITHILNLVGEGLYSMPEVGPVEVLYHPDSFVYKHITAVDTRDQDLMSFFKDTNEFIAKGRKSGGVLVHCWAGVSRSVSCICAYLMEAHGFTFQAALSQIRITRGPANPNEGFRRQLENYENSLKANGKIAVAAPKPPAPLFPVNYEDDTRAMYGGKKYLGAQKVPPKTLPQPKKEIYGQTPGARAPPVASLLPPTPHVPDNRLVAPMPNVGHGQVALFQQQQHQQNQWQHQQQQHHHQQHHQQQQHQQQAYYQQQQQQQHQPSPPFAGPQYAMSGYSAQGYAAGYGGAREMAM